MTHATSVARRSATSSLRVSGAALVRIVVLAAVVVGVMALAVVLCLAWLAGDAPDLYTRSSGGIERSIPIVSPVSATFRAPGAHPSR